MIPYYHRSKDIVSVSETRATTKSWGVCIQLLLGILPKPCTRFHCQIHLRWVPCCWLNRPKPEFSSRKRNENGERWGKRKGMWQSWAVLSCREPRRLYHLVATIALKISQNDQEVSDCSTHGQFDCCGVNLLEPSGKP